MFIKFGLLFSILFGSVLLLLAEDAQASLAFSRNSRTFETVHSNLVVKGMAHACLNQAHIPDALPCNPALTPLNKKPGLNAELLLSNGYANIQNIRKLLAGEFNQELADVFFSKDKVIQIEAGVDAMFVSKYLNAQYSPVSVKAFSVVRNEADPDIDFYSVDESGFTFQTGLETYKNLFIGFQGRFLDRKYIKSQFKLTALGTQAGREMLTPKKQNIIFIEPGVSWISDTEWKFRTSAFLANSGIYSTDDATFKNPVDIQVGIAMSPPVQWGSLDINLDFKSLSYEEKSDFEKLHLGAMYSFGSMYLTGGLDIHGISSGISYALDKFNAGVLYSTTRYIKDNDNYYTQTVYVQLGWQI